MDLMQELFGTFSGLLVVGGLLFMIVGMPLVIRWIMGHTPVSPAEQMDRKAHPENYTK